MENSFDVEQVPEKMEGPPHQVGVHFTLIGRRHWRPLSAALEIFGLDLQLS